MNAADEVTCRELVDLVTDYLEAALAEPILSLVEAHLVLCDGCAIYVDQVRTTVALLKWLPREPPPARLREAITDALTVSRA